MNLKTFQLFGAILGILFYIPVSYGISAKEIIEKSEYFKGEGLPGLEMSLYVTSFDDKGIKERVLRLEVGGLPNGTDDHSLAYFVKPAKYKGRMLLTSRGNMWFIRPGLSKPVPISARQKMLGSASNGDIASTNFIDNYKPHMVAKEIIDKEPFLVIELNAINNKATYDRIVYWVSEKSFHGVKADFYTASGKLLKTAEFEYENEVEDQGISRKFLSKMKIFDRVQTNNRTIMEYRNVRAKLINASTFNLNLLVR